MKVRAKASSQLWSFDAYRPKSFRSVRILICRCSFQTRNGSTSRVYIRAGRQADQSINRD